MEDKLQIEKVEILKQIDDQGISLNKLLEEFKVSFYDLYDIFILFNYYIKDGI